MKTWMIISFNVVRCRALLSRSLRKNQPSHVMWMSYSPLLLLKKIKKNSWTHTEPRKRYCFSSAFRERDSRRSETRTNAFHPFFQPNTPPHPPGDTVLRRAPRSLGSALCLLVFRPLPPRLIHIETDTPKASYSTQDSHIVWSVKTDQHDHILYTSSTLSFPYRQSNSNPTLSVTVSVPIIWLKSHRMWNYAEEINQWLMAG